MNEPPTANDVSLHSDLENDSNLLRTSRKKVQVTSSGGDDADGDVMRSHIPTAMRKAPDGSEYRYKNAPQTIMSYCYPV